MDTKEIIKKRTAQDFEVLEAIKTGLKKANQLSDESFAYMEYKKAMDEWNASGRIGKEPEKPKHLKEKSKIVDSNVFKDAVEHFESSVKQHFTKK